MEHDNSYKLLFSHAVMVEDLLRGFVHEEWVQGVDFATLEKVSASYVSDDLREREDDIVWRVRWGKEWLYVYLLLEFQASVDSFMAVRIMSYVGLLYQDLIRTKQLTSTGRLPPVLPVVLYNGRLRWQAPVEIADLIETVPGGLEQYRPHLCYLLLDEGRYGETELTSVRNLVSALFRLENSRTPVDVQRVLGALLEWLQAPEQLSLRRAFTVWIKRVFLPGRLPGVALPDVHDLLEVKAMLAERVVEWTEQWKQQGLEEGRRQGLEEGRRQALEEGREEGRQQGEFTLLLRLLERKFGSVDDATQQRIAAADEDRLLQWGERVLTATTLHEVFNPSAS